MRSPRALIGLSLLAALAAAGAFAYRWHAAEELEEEEERDQERDHFWRARIAIVGSGRVRTFIDAFDCSSDSGALAGRCGPKLVRFKERAPATMEATPAPGWTFDHWESETLEPDGAARGRPGRMPDGHVYLNGFGYADTGELETVTAVFVRILDAGSEGAD